MSVGSVRQQLMNVWGVLWSPERTAERVRRRSPLIAVLGVLALMSALLAFWRSGLTMRILSGGRAPGSDTLSAVRGVSLLASPVGLVLKVTAASLVMWAILVVFEYLPYRGVFSALLHAEIPLLIGSALDTLLLLQLHSPTGRLPRFRLGVNVLFPPGDLSPPLAALLGRINPFMMWWGLFLYLWLDSATRMNAVARLAVVLGFWSLLTAFQVGIGLLTGAGEAAP